MNINELIGGDRQDLQQVCLGDFGISKNLRSTASLCQTVVGTQAPCKSLKIRPFWGRRPCESTLLRLSKLIDAGVYPYKTCRKLRRWWKKPCDGLKDP